MILVRTALSPRLLQASSFVMAGLLSSCSYQGEFVSAKAEPPINARPAAQALPPPFEMGLWRPITVTLKPATLRLIRSQELYVRAYLSNCEGLGTGQPHELYLGEQSITANPSDLRGAPGGGKGTPLVLYANADEISRLKRLCVSISGGSMVGATLKTSEIPVAFDGTAAIGAPAHP